LSPASAKTDRNGTDTATIKYQREMVELTTTWKMPELTKSICNCVQKQKVQCIGKGIQQITLLSKAGWITTILASFEDYCPLTKISYVIPILGCSQCMSCSKHSIVILHTPYIVEAILVLRFNVWCKIFCQVSLTKWIVLCHFLAICYSPYP
jgi:hypothetical protein